MCPRLVSAGYALSPYLAAADYSSTEARARQLWVEVAEAPADGDALFARVLAYGPDPLLYVDVNVLHAEPPAEPALPTRSRSRPAHLTEPAARRGRLRGDDPPASPRPTTRSASCCRCPRGCRPDDPRLFGMWTYELRFGHVGAVEHRPRPLRPAAARHRRSASGAGAAVCRIMADTDRLPAARSTISSSRRPYAAPVLDGRQVGDGLPRTSLGFLLYAQGTKADGCGHRNVVLAHRAHNWCSSAAASTTARRCSANRRSRCQLDALGMPATSPLSVLAVEFFSPGGTVGAEYVSSQEARL